MSSPYLPDDCISNILKYLQDDRSTLFNCLLVNRLWCRETVPLLYKNPFNQILFSNNKKYKIIFTFILCFDKEESLQFKNQLNQYDINININDLINEPLFEYSKYIEYYNFLLINRIIFVWCSCYLNINGDHEIVGEFISTFHQSNLRKSIDIKQFVISFHFRYQNYQNYNIQSITQNFSEFKSLSFCDKGEELLKSIANNCLNLRKLEFSNGDQISIEIKKILYTIIQKQNKLKAFKMYLCDSLLSYIFSSLEFQKHSLVYIEFENISLHDISFENLITLYNLKYLNFNNCDKLSIDKCKILNFASFKLKELTIQYNNWNDEVTSLIIKYLGESLQKLYFHQLKLTILIIEYLSLYCLNLNNLRILINIENYSSLIPYFKNIRISNLFLCISRNNFSIDFTDEIMGNFAKNLKFFDVKEISIQFFSHDSFELKRTILIKTFFENLPHHFETISLNIYINSENLEIILNYIKKENNSLKFLGMEKLERVLNDEETKLLDQIRTRGVSLINFSCIYHECIPITYNSF